MKPFRRLALLLAATLAVSACASRVAAFPGETSVAGSMRLADVGVPEAARPFFLTIYPTPRAFEYGAVLLPLAGARVVDDADPKFNELLREQGLDQGWSELTREGYVLAVTAEFGRVLVLKAARDDAGRRWADQAFAQLTHETADGKFARECRVVDAPVFALRGNKRPLAWETKYRANFA